MDSLLFHDLIRAEPQVAAQIARTLDRFGGDALRFAHARRIRVVALAMNEPYALRSRALARLGVDVDAWNVPPAGLFVVEERTLYLRSFSAMTVAHEFGHGLDCALGDGVYASANDMRIRTAFAAAREWITPYAATRIDEYFAEGIRAYVEANDPLSPWPRVTRRRLATIDPLLHAYIAELFAERFTVQQQIV